MYAAAIDTHAVLWYLTHDPKLTDRVKDVIAKAAERKQRIAVSSITLIEIIYLTEKGRIPKDNYDDLLKELVKKDTILFEVAVDHEIAVRLSTISREAIPDMPDRIIAATALHLGVPLISRDGKIKVSGIQTIW